jgi:hypothetical protein
MKTIIAMCSLGLIGSSANYAFLGQTDQWFIELAKSWPFGCAIIVIVWIFLKHLKQSGQSQEKFIKELTERSHQVQDYSNRIAGEVNTSLNVLHATISENTRAIDRLVQKQG